MNDIEVRRTILAPPDDVFELWTNPDQLKQWWGPPGVKCTEAFIDLKVGGTYRICNLLPNGALVWIHGVFEIIERPAMLCYSWGIGLDSIPNERVSVWFKTVTGGTEITIVHRNAPDESTAQSHQHGWFGCLDGLEKHLGRHPEHQAD